MMVVTGGIFLALVATKAVAAPTSAPATNSTTTPLTGSNNATTSAGNVTSPMLQADGFTSPEWVAALERAREIVRNMTLAEKVNFTDHATDNKGCSALTLPIERFNISQMCYGDGPTGVNSRYSSQFPAQVTTAATWDVELFASRAEAMAKEFKAAGIHVPLAIVAGGPMGRSVYGGRNWENFSPDPYLTGVAARLTVEGFQKHNVHGHVKHFLGNEQEYLRIGATNGGYVGGQANQTVNSIIDPATEREVYAWAFAEAVRAGAASVMCSYNQLNGTVSCENGGLIQGLLKEELNAHSSVVSDWFAVHNGTRAALNGTDIVQPVTLWGNTIAAQIANGSVPTDILDDKIVRQITPYIALNQSELPEPDYTRYIATKESKENILAVAQASLTLLKNVHSTNSTRGLPLDKPTDLLLVGNGASAGPYGFISNIGTIMTYSPLNANTSSGWEEAKGYISDGWGSGGSPAPYVVDPFQGISRRGLEEDRPVVVDGYFDNDPLAGMTTAPGPMGSNSSFLDYKLSYASSAIVFVGTSAMEGWDRVDLKLANSGDELIQYTAARHSDVIVVINAPGPVEMDWADHPNITAIVYAYFPSPEGGNAIASVLFGDVNPGGKLPFTIARNVSDYPMNRYDGPIAVNPVANFSEGTLIDYRHFDASNSTPRFEFGFGMSYTNFSYSDLQIANTPEKQTALVRETNEKLVTNNGTSVGLYDVAYTVRATIANSGQVKGAEVAQLYLSLPNAQSYGMPIRALRGFAKPNLDVGQSETVEFKLRNKDMAYWSPSEQGWVIPEGDFVVSVGPSSRTLPLTGTISR